MAWQLTRSLVAARDAFNRRFPNRSKVSDGSIGDDNHKKSRSGHNPDGTPGSLSEFEDADNIPEVRAIDVDSKLNEPGVSMWDVVQAILKTPRDRDRLTYIIYNNQIWSKSNGWGVKPYYGDNPHTSHVHLSGNPASDDDDAPWESILNYGKVGEDDMFTIKGTNGTYLVTSEVDLKRGTPIALGPISQAAFADYQAAGIRHVNVNYVNPNYYSIQAAPVEKGVPTSTGGNTSLPPGVVDLITKAAEALTALVNSLKR